LEKVKNLRLLALYIIAQNVLCVRQAIILMGFLKWIIIGAIVALPVLASFAMVPSSPAPQGVGEYINGIVQYWKEVISQINVPTSSTSEPMPTTQV